MHRVVFITGLPGSGKSSLVQEIAKGLRIKAGGIATPEIRSGGIRRGFKIIDLASGKEGILASTDIRGRPRLGKYGVNIRDIEEIGVKAIENALENPEVKLVVIDELGKMELCSSKFEDVMEKALNSRKDLLIVLHRWFVNRYRNRGMVFVLTRENRDRVKEDILKLLR